jgi:hypothetical protein
MPLPWVEQSYVDTIVFMRGMRVGRKKEEESRDMRYRRGKSGVKQGGERDSKVRQSSKARQGQARTYDHFKIECKHRRQAKPNHIAVYAINTFDSTL